MGKNQLLIKFIFLLFLSLLSVSIQAQNQLPNLAFSEKNNLITELETIAARAEVAFADQQIPIADSLSKLLKNRAEKLNSRYFEGRANLLLGKVDFYRKNYQKSYFHLFYAAELFSKLSDYQYIAIANLELGKSYYILNEFNESVNCFKISDSLQLAFEFKLDMIELNRYFGLAEYNLGNSIEAIYYFGLYRKYSVMFQKWENQIESNILLSNAFRVKKSYVDAIQYDFELIKNYKQLRRKELPEALLILAKDQKANKDISLAKSTFQLVLDQSHDSHLLVDANLSMGEILESEQYFQEAVSHYSKALSYNFQKYQLQLSNAITRCYLALNQIDKAEEFSSKAFTLANDANPGSIIQTYLIRESLLLKKKKYKEAQIIHNQLIFYSDSINDLSNIIDYQQNKIQNLSPEKKIRIRELRDSALLLIYSGFYQKIESKPEVKMPNTELMNLRRENQRLEKYIKTLKSESLRNEQIIIEYIDSLSHQTYENEYNKEIILEKPDTMKFDENQNKIHDLKIEVEKSGLLYTIIGFLTLIIGLLVIRLVKKAKN